MAEVSLHIAGKYYLGWTECRISRALDSLVGAFSLQLTSRETTGLPRWPLRAGSACTIHIDGALVISGWIDRLSSSIDKDSATLTISGRDKAADLVDCSAIHKPGSWVNVPLLTIVTALLKPFGIDVQYGGATGANIKRFALQQGETVWEAIERLCRYRGLLAWSLADGTVHIGPPLTGVASVALVEGENILAADITHDSSDRYSQYIVKGQSSGSDDNHGKTVSAMASTSGDGAVDRYRPLIIIAEEQADLAALQKRAKWEANVRAARAQELTVRVQGWRTEGVSGALWAIGMSSPVRIPSLFVDQAMMVVGVDFERGSQGTTSQLRLQQAEAWTLLPLSEDASALGGR